jgi:acetylglutamate kinase
MKTPIGFFFSGASAGIKPHRKDVALVCSRTPCAAAACVTVNKAKAAPAVDTEKRVPASGIFAVVINSGNANALTGIAGDEAVQHIHTAAAAALGTVPSAILSASTGVIGVPMPYQKVTAIMAHLVGSKQPHATEAAEAIMTTDTRPKMGVRELVIDGKAITLSAICKGSGMIAPQLATMIAVLTTDCAITPQLLQDALREAMDPTFNCLTVDCDMSTNDVVYALANGEAGNVTIDSKDARYNQLRDAMLSLCEELAKEIAADGEGATKRLETFVDGAPSVAIAQDIAKAVCGSPLVKSAMFGADPNWGRVLATVGARAGSQNFAVDPYVARVVIQNLTVYDRGPANVDKADLRARMREPEIRVEIYLGTGSANATAWGCDLSYDYVKINADYTSLVVQTETGGVKKDDRLTNYSPRFKVNLVVEALRYMSKFRGQRCVIKYGGASMTKESLKLSFASDVSLLRSVGLLPIVVHSGGDEVARALARQGSGNESHIDGMRVTSADELPLVEMVLSGKVNTELVTLLNRSGANAVGLSGKDANLLTARKIVRDDGQDMGALGELVAVRGDFIELLLAQGYVPVVSPIGMSESGETFHLNGDDTAAAIAKALRADKLVFLADAPGIVVGGELDSDVTAAHLNTLLEAGKIAGPVLRKAMAAIAAVAGGVKNVHIIDGRTPHNMIAELFTDNGVGTIVRAEAFIP